MKKFLGILVLGLFLITPSQADDIRDFQIEGMSVGDSALDFFSEEQINSFYIIKYPTSEKFIGRESDLSFNNYDQVSFHFKKKDENYKIVSLKGIKRYDNQLNICREEKKKTILEVENSFDLKKKTHTRVILEIVWEKVLLILQISNYQMVV